MALKTTLEQLEHLQTVIENTETDIASYQDGDIRIARAQAQLDILYKRERYLQAKYNRSRRNGGRIRANFSKGVG